MRSRDERHQRGAIGPGGRGPSHLAPEPGRARPWDHEKADLPPEHGIEGTRHTLTYEISEFLDRVWAAGEPLDRDEAS